MKHSSGDIVLVEGNNELNVQMVPITGLANVYGVVTDASTGLPLEGVKVTAEQMIAQTYTDANGAYQLQGLPTGDLTIFFEKEGYGTGSWRFGLHGPPLAPGGNELNVQMVPLAAVGMITLYLTGFNIETFAGWRAYWYYTDTGNYELNMEDYDYRGASEPCTPPRLISLTNLLVKALVRVNVPGWAQDHIWHGPFGPFVVRAGVIYTLNIETGELSER